MSASPQPQPSQLPEGTNTIMSRHNHPRFRIHRAIQRLVLLGLVAMAAGIAAQLVLALILAPLFGGTALFTAILAIPLLLQSVLHPEITVMESGLRLRPFLWRSDVIPWSAVTHAVEHPLLLNDEVTGRKLHGTRYKPRMGMVIVLRGDTVVLPLYRLVGQVAGVGNVPAFAISSTTHTDYDRLATVIAEHLTT